MFNLFRSINTQFAFKMFSFEIASKTSNFPIKYGYADCRFGKCFVGLTGDAICHLHFVDRESKAHIGELQKRFPRSTIEEDASKDFQTTVDTIFSDSDDKTHRLVLQGTDFQIQVWQQLCKIPKGSTCSYEDVAIAMDKPKAIRPAANAIAGNEIAYLIPCHRVIAKSGKAKYRWGPDRKIQILRDEGVELD